MCLEERIARSRLLTVCHPFKEAKLSITHHLVLGGDLHALLLPEASHARECTQLVGAPVASLGEH